MKIQILKENELLESTAEFDGVGLVIQLEKRKPVISKKKNLESIEIFLGKDNTIAQIEVIDDPAIFRPAKLKEPKSSIANFTITDSDFDDLKNSTKSPVYDLKRNILYFSFFEKKAHKYLKLSNNFIIGVTKTLDIVDFYFTGIPLEEMLDLRDNPHYIKTLAKKVKRFLPSKGKAPEVKPKRRKKVLELGSVIEIKTNKGLTYLQYVFEHKEPPYYGTLIRVLEGNFKERPKDFKELVEKKERYYLFTSIEISVRKKMAEIVAVEAVPKKFHKIPDFRSRGRFDEKIRKFVSWIIEYSNGTHAVVENLSEEQKDIPIWRLVSHQGLVDKIESDWLPRKEI